MLLQVCITLFWCVYLCEFCYYWKIGAKVCHQCQIKLSYVIDFNILNNSIGGIMSKHEFTTLIKLLAMRVSLPNNSKCLNCGIILGWAQTILWELCLLGPSYKNISIVLLWCAYESFFGPSNFLKGPFKIVKFAVEMMGPINGHIKDPSSFWASNIPENGSNFLELFYCKKPAFS